MPIPKAFFSVAFALFAICPTAAEVDLPDGLLVPLSGTDPAVESSSADLLALAEWLGEAQVVGLGESIHGVDDFRRLAHRIFAHLAKRHGFGLFALEIDQAHAARLNDFVAGRRDDLDALLAERWWASATFYDQALRELLLWMRQYRATADRPVQFAGFDFRQPSLAMKAVVDGLRRLDPMAAAQAEALYDTVLGLGGFGVYPNVYGLSGSLGVPLPSRGKTRTLRIRLKARGRGVTHGWIGLSVEDPGRGSEGARDTLYLSAGELSEAWTPLDLETEVASDVQEIRLVIFHRGNGTVWFDELSLALDGRSLELDEGLEGIGEQPLEMPRIQVMDYDSSLDDQVSYSGGRSLRVDCDPAVDRALRAAREVDSLLRSKLAAARGRLPSSEESWLRQMSRLVLQATEYRTLVETNRDVFLAENIAWLERHGFPGSRVLALAHSSHTNRKARGRGMGLVLADEYGDRYQTVTMLALSGQFSYFGDPRTLGPDAELKRFDLKPEDAGPLERRLGSLGSGDLLFHLKRATGSESGRARVDLGAVPVGDLADVAVLLRSVRPSLVP